jgi:hypothetical protein
MGLRTCLDAIPPDRNQTSAVQPVSIPTELTRLLIRTTYLIILAQFLLNKINKLKNIYVNYIYDASPLTVTLRWLEHVMLFYVTSGGHSSFESICSGDCSPRRRESGARIEPRTWVCITEVSNSWNFTSKIQIGPCLKRLIQLA